MAMKLGRVFHGVRLAEREVHFVKFLMAIAGRNASQAFRVMIGYQARQACFNSDSATHR